MKPDRGFLETSRVEMKIDLKRVKVKVLKCDYEIHFSDTAVAIFV